MIDFPFLFLAFIRLHSYRAFIRARHSARMLLRREGAGRRLAGAGAGRVRHLQQRQRRARTGGLPAHWPV